MSNFISFEIPGDPQGKQRPRFGNGRTYTPKETTEYEQVVQAAYMTSKHRETYHGAVAVRIMAFFGVPRSASKAAAAMMCDGTRVPTKKPDIDNIVKIIMDALNGLAYDDDKQVTQVTAFKCYGEEPKVQVEVWEI